MTLEASMHDYQRVATMAHVHGLAHAGQLTPEQANTALAILATLADGESPSTLSPDQHATAFRLWIRDAILDVAALLADLRQALTDLAERAGSALAPANGADPPVLLGHYLLAYVEQLYRDGNRLKEAYVRADILPLDTGDAGALDRGAVARLLGMHATTRNSLDGVGDRDFAIETMAALATIGAHLARLIGDPVLDIPAPPAPAQPRAMPKPPAAPTIVTAPTPTGTDDNFWVRRLARTRNPGGLISEEWQSALIALARIPQGYHASLAKIEAATARAVERTQAALRLAIDLVRDLPISPPDPSSPGADSLTFVTAADTHARIDAYRRWIAERRAAHPTVDTLRHFPAPA